MLIDTARLPRETKDIFDTLRNGNFIVDDHPDSYQRRLYSVCSSNHNVLFSYFEHLGYELTEGDGYYIFTIELSETAREHRMDQILSLLDLVELFYGAFGGFDVGWSGSPSELELVLKNDIVRMERFEKMRGISGKSLNEMCESAFMKMYKYGCMAKLNDKLDTYKVIASFNYVKEFFEALQRMDAEPSDEKDNA